MGEWAGSLVTLVMGEWAGSLVTLVMVSGWGLGNLGNGEWVGSGNLGDG